jgi:hypothetical protein
LPAHLQSFTKLSFGCIVTPQRLQGLADDIANLDLYERLILELAIVQLAHGREHQLNHGDLIAQHAIGICRRQHFRLELCNGLRDCGLFLRLPALPGLADKADTRAYYPGDQDEQNYRSGDGQPLIPPDELPQSISTGWRCAHRLICEISKDIGRQLCGRLVPAATLLLQRFHHDPVQLAMDQPGQLSWLGVAMGCDRSQRLAAAQPRAWTLRFLFADNPQHFVERRRPEPGAIEGRLSS